MNITRLLALLIVICVLGCTTEKGESPPERSFTSLQQKGLDEFILDKDKLDLKGKVKSCLEYYYKDQDISDEFIQLSGSKYESITADKSIQEIRKVDLSTSESYLFDRSGKVTRVVNYNEDRHFDLRIENHIYDREGRIREWNSLDSDGEIDRKKEFQYDSQGRLSSYNEMGKSNQTSSSGIYTYGQDYIERKSISLRAGDTLHNSTTKFNIYGDVISENSDVIRTYNDQGYILKEEYGSSADRVEYRYDSRNNKIEETKYDSTNAIVEINMFLYNERDELIKKFSIDTSHSDFQEYENQQLGFGFSMFSSNNHEDQLAGAWRVFDDRGNSIKHIYIEAEGGSINRVVSRTEHIYDDIGNWVSRSYYRNDSLTSTVERIIRYY